MKREEIKLVPIPFLNGSKTDSKLNEKAFLFVHDTHKKKKKTHTLAVYNGRLSA